MRRALGFAALVALVIGLPLAIALLGGADDEPAAGPAADVRDRRQGGPPALRDDGPRGRNGPPKGDNRRAGGRGQGGPPHDAGFDRQMTGVAYPTQVTASGTPAAREIVRLLGRQVTPGQRTVFAADCRDGTCSIRYRSKPRGRGTIIKGQARVVRALFRRRDVSRIVLYVHHAIVGRGKEERPAFVVTTCSRGTGSFDWTRVTTAQLPRRCDINKNAGGKLRNQVRRGHVSVDEASRGKAPDGSERARRPGGGRGDPMPRNVAGSAAAERTARDRRNRGG